MTTAPTKLHEAMGEFEEAWKHQQRAHHILSSGPASYYWEKVKEYIDALFTRFAPFQEGDRVELVDDLKIDPRSHWYGSRHFLIKGGKGTVHGVDYRNGKFVADVVLDDESWIDEHRVLRPRINQHTYHITEHECRKITP